jgi:hypothetical protein
MARAHNIDHWVPFISIGDVFSALGILAHTHTWLCSRLQTNLQYGEVLEKLYELGWLSPETPLPDDWDDSCENNFANLERVPESSNSLHVNAALSQDIETIFKLLQCLRCL